MTNGKEWPVSQRGGTKISGNQAAKIMKVSYSQMYRYMERGELQRADRMHKGLRKQRLNFWLADILDLAVEYDVMTREEADHFLQPMAAVA